MNLFEEIIAVCNGYAPMTERVRYVLGKYAKEHEAMRAEVDRLMRQLADATNEATRARLEAKRAVEQAYHRGAEAMREACANAFAEYEGAGLSAQILAMELPIPEEP
jgi:hypothetical protein